MKKLTKQELKFLEGAARRLSEYRILMDRVSEEKLVNYAKELDFITTVSNYAASCQINFIHEILKTQKG